jgi:dTMP kinase
MGKGFLLTFEGIDFSGKSAQANLLRDRLINLGVPVLFLREPGGTEISEKIRDVLLDTQHTQMSAKAELLLYAAARAQIVTEQIAPSLLGGKTVICDRYFDSTTAYQGFGRQIDLDFIEKLHTFVIEKISPDITFLIDLDPEEALRRKRATDLEKDRLDQEAVEFHRRVRDGYLQIAEKETDRFVTIDGSQSLDEIHKQIFKVTKARLKL